MFAGTSTGSAYTILAWDARTAAELREAGIFAQSSEAKSLSGIEGLTASKMAIDGEERDALDRRSLRRVAAVLELRSRCAGELPDVGTEIPGRTPSDDTVADEAGDVGHARDGEVMYDNKHLESPFQNNCSKAEVNLAFLDLAKARVDQLKESNPEGVPEWGGKTIAEVLGFMLCTDGQPAAQIVQMIKENPERYKGIVSLSGERATTAATPFAAFLSGVQHSLSHVGDIASGRASPN